MAKVFATVAERGGKTHPLFRVEGDSVWRWPFEAPRNTDVANLLAAAKLAQATVVTYTADPFKKTGDALVLTEAEKALFGELPAETKKALRKAWWSSEATTKPITRAAAKTT